MIKKIVYTIILFALLATSANALEGNVKEIMSTKIHSALNILKNKKESNELKAEQIFKMFDEVFDYNLMARLSLGKKEWMNISKEERQKYVKTFISLLKQSFIEKLKLYNNQDMIIKDFIKSRPNRAKLLTELVGKKDTINIIYKFYRSKKRGWIIYDVIVADVSIIQSYREQFSDLLNHMNFTDFLKKIKKADTKGTNA